MTELNRHALNVLDATPDHAQAVLEVIKLSFGARPKLDPPSTALDETEGTVAAALDKAGGLLVERRGKPIGAMIFDESRPGQLGYRRVSVDPGHQDRGVASAMVGVAEDTAEERGHDGIWLNVREELPDNVEFWTRRRYIPVQRENTTIEFGKTLWLARELHTPQETHGFGIALAGLLRAGDLLVMTGALGAGKTTLTQGIGEGLGVRGPITSPTFVISRTHPSLVGGPPLVHVDAYRLGDSSEIDDIDLDASADESVTVVEWGAGMAEQLGDSWLSIKLERRQGNELDPLGTLVDEGGEDEGGEDESDESDGDTRVVMVKPHGRRWVGVPLRSTLIS